MYSTNCKVCGTKSSRNGRRCQKHERTWTYIAVRDFPVKFLKTKWYVYHELPGMWWELKHKQQKMPKARANTNVYSSARCSGFSLILSCLTVSFSCGIVYSRVKRTPESEKRRRTYIWSNGKSKRKCWWYVYQVRIYVYIPFCSSTRRRCEL